MRIYGRRPLTRLEAGIYGGLAAVLLTALALRLVDYMEVAERAAMEATLMQLMSAGATRLAYGTMRGGAQDVATRNPFELAGISPRNFSGEIDPLQPKALERGFWAFDRDRHELIYLPRLRAALQTSDPEGAIRFRVEVNTKEMRYQLVPTSPYQWE